ncbi:MAG TPA: glycogen-binding domain-containing protein [Gemmatimonadales bacterium]|nr:glycogen-binding domain-containing protein [Gemmatimonadales bacterium]
MRFPHRPALAALAALLAAAPAPAQGRFLLDLSGGATRHQYTEEGTTLSLAPRFLYRSAAVRLDAGLTYSRGASFRWNAEGGLDGAVAKRLGGGFSAELAAGGWWTAHRVGQGTGQVTLLPALRMSRRTMDLLLEAGAGNASTVNGGRRFGLLGARTRWFLGPIDVQGQVQRVRFSERTLRWGNYWGPFDPRADTLPGATADTIDTLREYSDLGVTLGWSMARIRLSLGLEQRVGLKEFRATAWHAEATRALGTEAALFASTGRTLSALTSGLPARRYLSLGVRWAPGGGRRSGLRPLLEAGGRSIRIVRDGTEAAARILLWSAGAATVEVMGDFSNWEPLTLSGAGAGWWLLPLKLAPGLYRLNVRYDGGRWETPAGLPSEDDEFNGRVGVLLIVP